MRIPNYLSTKLADIGIYELEELREAGYLEVYARLKVHFTSLGYQALFDLHDLLGDLLGDNEPTARLSSTLQQQLIQAFKQLPPRYPELPAALLTSYMQAAQEQAELAVTAGEIPIGAVIIYEEKIIARGHNQTLTQQDILAHAEIQALRQAQQYLNNYRLTECDLYVTVEPCLMCSGAIINSRIRRVVFGASEPRTGAICSQYQIFANSQTNHHAQVIGPLDQAKYSQLLRDFLTARRVLLRSDPTQ